MNDLGCDVAIIGAGTAGLAAERAARVQGASTLLIDPLFAGTTCTTVGCMPSKLLIAAGNAAHNARQASVFGVKSDPQVDGVAVMKRLKAMRAEFVEGFRKQFDALPEGVARKSHARFKSESALVLEDGTTITTQAVVIATGARPSIPDFLDDVAHAVLTSETLFDLDDLPHSVGVVGAGPLGLELAQALARLGVEVAVFDEEETLAGLDDDAVAKVLQGALKREFPIHLGVGLAAKTDGKAVALSWTGATKGSATFEHILAAAGRPPALGNLDFEKTGLELDDHDAPNVDPTTMQVGDAPIFMAGDADHERPVLHEAQAEGAIAGRNAARFPKVEKAERMVPLSIMFTSPAMAQVGKLPESPSTVRGLASYADQGWAKMFAVNGGCVTIHAETKDGKLLAATMVGPAIEHSAHLLALAIQNGMTAAQMLAMPFYHPTYEEGLQPALRDICKAVGKTPPIVTGSCRAPEPQEIPSSANALRTLSRAMSRS
ncbi:dihydrolipoyl dehydrogenase [Novosphingobium sp. BL-52-GroH]|uniref:dihydrolipoyl dehydrogenase n=1 Tax=Novosphingobium sp. BL-52-GroH TaxID=3349877 RepID=UPI00384F6A89